jgi:hypothetical protein
MQLSEFCIPLNYPDYPTRYLIFAGYFPYYIRIRYPKKCLDIRITIRHLSVGQSENIHTIYTSRFVHWKPNLILTRTEAPLQCLVCHGHLSSLSWDCQASKQSFILWLGVAWKSHGSGLKSPVNQTLVHLPCSLKCVEVRRAHACRTQRLLRLLLQKRCNKSTMEFNGWCEALISIATASWKKKGEMRRGLNQEVTLLLMCVATKTHHCVRMPLVVKHGEKYRS